ncbi:MAG: deoxyguanosinetriphosphate triphosphohydrolase [Spirochaetes bacterium]|nr:deoxyguanosinetriphosphate triphosphohydrolase [Spirochaetota bacterium]
MITVDRRYLAESEDKRLAPYAARSAASRGRKYQEAPHPYRTEYQRDRERIIHSRAFRRLEYKTQVFINHEGDHYRTRLTHTIEVAQIARSIARALRLNEDLAESVALAHDLGHTPFGHAGEAELNTLLRDHGGFEHNRQSLRIVEELEKRYSRFNGLNLTWETREGIIKHSTSYDTPEAGLYSPELQPSLEAQIIDYADEIAYNNHDLDDGLSSGLLQMEEVEALGIWIMAGKHSGIEECGDRKMMVNEMIRRIINLLVSDFIDYTSTRIRERGVKNYGDVTGAGEKLTGFSAPVRGMNDELKAFLRAKLYNHYRVARMTIKAQRVVRELFAIYTTHPDTLPDSYQERIPRDGVQLTATDYIAGMTDRYALEEHLKLTDPMIRV